MSIQNEANKLDLVKNYNAMLSDINAIIQACNSLKNNKDCCKLNPEYESIVSESETLKIQEVESFLSSIPW